MSTADGDDKPQKAGSVMPMTAAKSTAAMLDKLTQDSNAVLETMASLRRLSEGRSSAASPRRAAPSPRNGRRLEPDPRKKPPTSSGGQQQYGQHQQPPSPSSESEHDENSDSQYSSGGGAVLVAVYPPPAVPIQSHDSPRKLGTPEHSPRTTTGERLVLNLDAADKPEVKQRRRTSASPMIRAASAGAGYERRVNLKHGDGTTDNATTSNTTSIKTSNNKNTSNIEDADFLLDTGDESSDASSTALVKRVLRSSRGGTASSSSHSSSNSSSADQSQPPVPPPSLSPQPAVGEGQSQTPSARSGSSGRLLKPVERGQERVLSPRALLHPPAASLAVGRSTPSSSSSSSLSSMAASSSSPPSSPPAAAASMSSALGSLSQSMSKQVSAELLASALGPTKTSREVVREKFVRRYVRHALRKLRIILTTPRGDAVVRNEERQQKEHRLFAENALAIMRANPHKWETLLRELAAVNMTPHGHSRSRPDDEEDPITFPQFQIMISNAYDDTLDIDALHCEASNVVLRSGCCGH
jgi:hypothetical protein